MGLNKSKNLSLAKKTCDIWFSKYIRIRDADKYGMCICITCDTVKHWTEMDCGHFQSRRYLATRWDEKNAHAQCQRCNNFQAGEQYRHGQQIDLRYGDATARFLEGQARLMHKYTKQEVMDLAKYYKQETEKLAKEKGIQI